MRAEKGHLRYILAPVHLLYTLLYPVDDKIRHNDACSATTVSNGVCFFWQRGEHMGEREGGCGCDRQRFGSPWPSLEGCSR